MDTLNIVSLVLAGVLMLDALVLIWAIMKQEGTTEGLGSIMGGSNSDSFLGRNKAKTKEGRLARITKIATVVIVVLALALAVVVAIAAAA